MTVGELIHKLSKLDKDLKVVIDQYSDYTEAGQVEVINLVDKGYYLMSPHLTMSKDNVSKLTEVVYIGG